ncbi:MAG: STAS domain-containing protein [Candidatus Rokuibacteriota bacterium]
MLKIEVSEMQQERVTVHLEGQMVGPWVDELRRACEPLLTNGHALILDFSKVSFVDRAGVALCGRLKQGGATIQNCSPFVKEQIDA